MVIPLDEESARHAIARTHFLLGNHCAKVEEEFLVFRQPFCRHW